MKYRLNQSLKYNGKLYSPGTELELPKEVAESMAIKPDEISSKSKVSEASKDEATDENLEPEKVENSVKKVNSKSTK